MYFELYAYILMSHRDTMDNLVNQGTKKILKPKRQSEQVKQLGQI